MTELLEEAIARVEALPNELLEKLALEAMAEHLAGKTQVLDPETLLTGTTAGEQ